MTDALPAPPLPEFPAAPELPVAALEVELAVELGDVAALELLEELELLLEPQPATVTAAKATAANAVNLLRVWLIT